LASEKGYEHPFADVVLASKRKVFEWCEENDVANLVIAGGASLYNLFVKDCNRVIQSRLNHTLIPVKIFRHMKGKVFAPDLRVKGPWDSAEVLEKSNKMVVVEYVWRGGAVQ
jgi:dihydrofolate reductase